MAADKFQLVGSLLRPQDLFNYKKSNRASETSATRFMMRFLATKKRKQSYC